jgi:hypothetical protein
MGFEPTIPVFEGAKTVHASDRGATVIGTFVTTTCKLSCKQRMGIKLYLTFSTVITDVIHTDTRLKTDEYH